MGHAFDFIRFIDLDFCLHSPLLLGARFHIKVILKSERQKPLRNTHIEKDYLWVVGIIRKDCRVNQINAKSYHCQRFCLFIFTTQHLLFMIDL